MGSTSGLTSAQRDSARRRVVFRVANPSGFGCRALPGDTEEVARAVFAGFDPELALSGLDLVDVCRHAPGGPGAHDFDECDRPVPTRCWTAGYPAMRR